MLTSGISNTWWCHSVGEPCDFMDSLCFYFFIFCLAGVIANDFGNLMLLTDVFAMMPFWICNLYFVLADVIASLFMTDDNVVAIWLMFLFADVIAIYFYGSMPFLDILITPKEDGSLSTSVFRKPTHIDLYLQWDSHHTISSKYSVAGTLYHRTKTICSDPQLLK